MFRKHTGKGKNNMKKGIAIQFQKDLSVPREDKTPNRIIRFISLACSTSIAKPLQRLLCFFSRENGKVQNAMVQMSKQPRRQELSVFLSPVSMTYMPALSGTSLCLGCLSLLACSLLAPRNLPLAHLLPDCPDVTQELPVTVNFFTVPASSERFKTLRCCGKGPAITNPPPLDPDLLWGPDTGPRYRPCGHAALKGCSSLRSTA